MRQTCVGIMRWEILMRDERDCVPCRLLGYCDPKGAGWCSGIQLPSPDLSPAVYKRLDALRSDNANLRLHLSHLRGKANEGWQDAVGSCPCHNYEISTEIREACLMYTAQFPKHGTPAFEEALAGRAEEKAEIKEQQRKARHSNYTRQKKRAGGSPLSKQKGKNPMRAKKEKEKQKGSPGKPPGISEKDWAQRQRPVYNCNPRP